MLLILSWCMIMQGAVVDGVMKMKPLFIINILWPPGLPKLINKLH